MSTQIPRLTWSFSQAPSFAPQLAPRPRPEVDLTKRQAEILYWVQEGKSSSDIGAILGLSHRTIEHHLENVCRRFGVRTRIQAVVRARDMGLIPANEGRPYPPGLGNPTPT